MKVLMEVELHVHCSGIALDGEALLANGRLKPCSIAAELAQQLGATPLVLGAYDITVTGVTAKED